MKKKAQFYLFAALIFVGAVFVIVANRTSINLRELGDFRNYRDNYLNEAKIVMNNAIRDNLNTSEELGEFTGEFIEYMEDKDIDLGVVLIYSHEEKIHIDNYLNEPVLITTLGISISPGEKTSAQFHDEIKIAYLNETYTYYFSGSEINELKTLFVKEE